MADQNPQAGNPTDPKAGSGQTPPTGGTPPPPPPPGAGQDPVAAGQTGAGYGQGYYPPPPPGYGYPPQGYYPYPPQQMPGGQQGYYPPPPPGYGYPPAGYPPMPPVDQGPITPIGSFGNDEKAFKTTIKVPAHSLNFDENLFLCLLSGSISLTKDEKKRIIEAVPKLSQYQIDELIKILQEEKRKFSELDMKHKAQLDELQRKHAQEWADLEVEMAAPEKQAAEEDQTAKLRASLGIPANDNEKDEKKGGGEKKKAA